MRHTCFFTAWILVFVIILAVPVWAGPQSSGQEKTVRIVLKDESELIGIVLAEDAKSVQFRTLAGVEMVIPKDKIASIEAVEVVGGKAVRLDPNRTRLFIAPTARPLRAGEGYFSVYDILLPYFAYGVTDFLALGGGISLVPGASNQLFYVAPKITPLRAKNFDLAAGVLYMAPLSSTGDHVGVVYGLGTFGTRRTALSVGLGWGFTGEGFANQPILLIGGELQLSNSVKLISENWIPFGWDHKFLSLGIRLFGRKLAADFALVLPTNVDMGGFPFIPWIGFTYNFGDNRQ
jgi:hypothetical protein